MNFKKLSFISLTAFSVLMIGCGSTETPVNTSNNGALNTAKTNSNNPLAVTTPTPEATTNNAPTLTPIFKAYCAAMVKKDEAALRKTYSRDTIEFFEERMKEDGIKSLIEYLSDDQVTNELCEVTNEKIQGDTASATIKTKGYPNGFPIVFVKENDKWKITNKKPTS